MIPDSIVEIYTTKKEVLSMITQEDIFEQLLGYAPVEGEYVLSPFRGDGTPGCHFEYDHNGKLYFMDYAYRGKTVNGTSISQVDCFDAVKLLVPGMYNFNKVLEHIVKNMVNKKTREKAGSAKTPKRRKKEPFILKVTGSRPFDNRDRDFWKPYGITSYQLESDGVFAVSSFFMGNTKKGDMEVSTDKLCYCIYNKGSSVKLYFPYSGQSFLSSCNGDDVGVTGRLTGTEPFVITKSYKDSRVLTNMGYDNLWFQAERMFPTDNIMVPYLKDHKKIFVMFDNDRAGVDGANEYCKRMSCFSPVSVTVPVMENVTDPSDLYREKGKSYLENTLKQLLT